VHTWAKNLIIMHIALGATLSVHGMLANRRENIAKNKNIDNRQLGQNLRRSLKNSVDFL
jgi:hypothetical protein